LLFQPARLAFSAFNLPKANPSCTDKMEFYDGASDDPANLISIGGETEFCDRNDIPYIVEAPSGMMYVKFITDDSGRQSGFRGVFPAPFNGKFV